MGVREKTTLIFAWAPGTADSCLISVHPNKKLRVFLIWGEECRIWGRGLGGMQDDSSREARQTGEKVVTHDRRKE